MLRHSGLSYSLPRVIRHTLTLSFRWPIVAAIGGGFVLTGGTSASANLRVHHRRSQRHTYCRRKEFCRIYQSCGSWHQCVLGCEGEAEGYFLFTVLALFYPVC
jgi:hypothetical protein